jgi:hypothetical protein
MSAQSMTPNEHAEPPTPEELAYWAYEALTDPFDEAVLLAQEAEGQPVEHLLEERRYELEEVRTELFGLSVEDYYSDRGQVADLEAER